MGYVIPPQAIETTRLSGLGRMAEYGKGERIFTKKQEQNFSAFVETGLVYLCAENEQYNRSILSFFRPGDWFSADMLLPIDHGGKLSDCEVSHAAAPIQSGGAGKVKAAVSAGFGGGSCVAGAHLFIAAAHAPSAPNGLFPRGGASSRQHPAASPSPLSRSCRLSRHRSRRDDPRANSLEAVSPSRRS